MDITNAVAINVKTIREQKKLTLDAAAELTGVSRSMLAQIEKGDVNPTISVLWKIANGYKVSFASLVEDRRNPTAVLRGAKMQPQAEDDGRYLNYLTVAFDERRLFESYRVVIHEAGKLEAMPHLKGAEEYITVYAGEVEITVDSKAYLLEKGDSIRFTADVPHSYRNVGAQDAEMNLITYYNKQ